MRRTPAAVLATFIVLAATIAACNTATSSQAGGTLRITDPANGSTVSSKSVTVRGSAPAGATVTQDISLGPDQHTTADASGNWQLAVDLDEGSNDLKFRIGDDESTAIAFRLTYAEPGQPVTPSGSASGAAATPPTKPAGATPKPTPKPKFTYKASGTHKSKAFTITLPARVDYTFTGRGNFIASIEATDKSGSEQIANIIGTYRATTWIYGEGTARVYVDVIADGKYTIVVTSDTKPGVKGLPAAFSGKWGLTTVPFAANGDVTIAYSHKGSGNFIVDLVDADTGQSGDLLVNEIGKVASDTSEFGLNGNYALNVIADGAWSISVKAQ